MISTKLREGTYKIVKAAIEAVAWVNIVEKKTLWPNTLWSCFRIYHSRSWLVCCLLEPLALLVHSSMFVSSWKEVCLASRIVFTASVWICCFLWYCSEMFTADDLCLFVFVHVFFVYLQPTRTSMSITFTHIAVALWEPNHSQPTLIWAKVRVSMWMCPICGMNLSWLMHLCTDLSFQPSAGFGICLAASRHSFTLPCILGQNMQKLCSSSNKC